MAPRPAVAAIAGTRADAQVLSVVCSVLSARCEVRDGRGVGRTGQERDRAEHLARLAEANDLRALRDEITAPLGMHRTRYNPPASWKPVIATCSSP